MQRRQCCRRCSMLIACIGTFRLLVLARMPVDQDQSLPRWVKPRRTWMLPSFRLCVKDAGTIEQFHDRS